MGKSDFEPTPVLERRGWVYGIKIAILVHSYIWFSEFRMKNRERETVISALSVSLSQHLKLWKRRRRLKPPPPEMYGGKNMPFANWELLFPGLDPGKELILSEFWQWSPRSSLKSTDMLQHVTKAAICFWKEFSKFSKMTLELKIYVVHSSPCVPQGLRQLGWVPTMC